MHQLIQAAADMGVRLTDTQATQMLAYLDAVLEENKAINVTAIRDREVALGQHLLDSLSLVALWNELHPEAVPTTVIDLGTGGGFPAIPLAVAWKESQVTAIDGTGKKIALVERCLNQTEINNVEAIQMRGFDFPKQQPARRRAYQLAVARAVGPAKKLIAELAPLVQAKGEIFLMKGAEPPDSEILEARKVMPQLGLEDYEQRPVTVPGLSPRSILIFRKKGKAK